MNESKSSPKKPRRSRGNRFRIQGKARLEQAERKPGDLDLLAYAFARGGELLGSGKIDARGGFDFAADLDEPGAVELVIGPAGDPDVMRKSDTFSKRFAAHDWELVENRYRLSPDLFIPFPIWWLWRPVRLCVSGHVRKIHEVDGHIEICPVPFVKVEIFDVDRESCYWPYLRRRLPDLFDRRVIRVPELIEKIPFPPEPIPGPDPAPFMQVPRLSSLQRETLQSAASMPEMSALMASQADEPMSMAFASSDLPVAVGEMRRVSAEIATRLEQLTLTSEIAPWHIFPHCFYSKELICETYTDCSGYFRCCFNWYPLQFRHGRLHFDHRPDIILRVTQIIDGVETVVYMDPYTSTRWDSGSTHIDLFLDNEEVRCGSPICNPTPAGSVAYYTLIGDHYVYHINQANGEYENAGTTNLAYGGQLRVSAQFGEELSDWATELGDPTQPRYYRLSYAKKNNPAHIPAPGDYKPIQAPAEGLTDTRVTKGTYMGSTYFLGPQTVNGRDGLYEIRDTTNYYWHQEHLIGMWNTWLAEANTGMYVLRLEIFDMNANKLGSSVVDYRDGTYAPTTPPTPMPPMTDSCDLIITLDNKAPVLTLITPATNECGLVEWVPGLALDFTAQIVQGNGRLHSWGLYYTKGTDSTPRYLTCPSTYPVPCVPPPVNGVLVSSDGSLDPVNVTIHVPNTHPMIAGLTGTCAFAIKLHAIAHITNGRHLIYYRENLQAIAIEKCS